MLALEGKEMDLKGMFSDADGLSAKIEEILKGVSFPTSKQDIINKAKEKGVDSTNMAILAKING